MNLEFFHLIFILATGTFLMSYWLKFWEDQVITSLLSGICFFALALSSFNVQLLDNAGTVHNLFSSGFALICGLFGFMNLLRMYFVIKMFRHQKDNIGVDVK